MKYTPTVFELETAQKMLRDYFREFLNVGIEEEEYDLLTSVSFLISSNRAHRQRLLEIREEYSKDKQKAVEDYIKNWGETFRQNKLLSLDELRTMTLGELSALLEN